jgi:hypothetical protein
MERPFFWYQSKYFMPIISVFVLLFIYSMWGRIPDSDDAWIGEYTYWFAKDGYTHSELMRGITHQEDLFVVHHKLFNFNGAFTIKVFGFSLYWLKAVGLFYFLVFLLLFYLYTRKWKKIFDRNDFLFALVILLAFPWVFRFAYIYRPETMMMAFGFAGFILLQKYLNNDKSVWWQLFLSGMFFGWAMAAHLNGLILVTAGGALLLWNKKYLSVFIYGIGVLAAFSVYFYDLTSIEALELWKEQFFHSPSLDGTGTNVLWLKPFYNLMNEHMRYFHDPKIIVFSVFMLFTLIIGFKYLYRHHTNLTRFALLVAIATGMLAMHKTRRYMLLDFPYLVMLITLTFKALKEKKITSFKISRPEIIRGVLLVLLAIFLIVSTFFNVLLSIQKFSPEQNRKLAEKYAGGNEKNMKIVAPMIFIFNEIEHFDQIQADVCYVELQKNDSTIYGEGFLEKAYVFDRDLLMISPFFQRKLGIDTYQKGDDFKHYRVIDKNEKMIVLKRKTPR